MLHTKNVVEPLIKEETINEQNDNSDKKVQYKITRLNENFLSDLKVSLKI